MGTSNGVGKRETGKRGKRETGKEGTGKRRNEKWELTKTKVDKEELKGKREMGKEL